jgi:hypothetical protein
MHFRPVGLLLVLLASGVGACGRTAAPPANSAGVALAAPPPPALPLTLVAADIVRPTLAATLVIPSLDRTIESGVALVQRAMPVPVEPAQVRDSLLAATGFPPVVLQNLDLSAPLTAAVVAGTGTARRLVSAVTFSGKDPARTLALIEGLGQVVARRGNAVQIRTPGGQSAWFLQVGNVVVFSDTEEGLVRAANLAIEARRAEGDDVTAVIYPEALARASGMDVKTAVEKGLEEARARAGAVGSGASSTALNEVQRFAKYLPDVEVLQLALDLDASQGASLRARLFPRGRSALAAIAQKTQPSALDPLLFGRGEMGFALSSAYDSQTPPQIDGSRVRLAAEAKDDRGAATALKLLEAFGEGRSGEMSLGGRVVPGPSLEGIYMLRNVAAGAKLQAALRAMDKEALAALTRAATAAWEIDLSDAKLRQEKVGTTSALRLTLPPQPPGRRSGGWEGLMPALLGDGPVEIFVAVIRSDRVAVAVGKNARAQIAAMAAGKTGAPSGPLSEAMTAGGGRSLFYFLDGRHLAPLLTGVVRDPRATALIGSGNLPPLPIFGGVRGDPDGRFMAFDLTLPPACFAGLGAVFQRAVAPR